MSGPPPQVWLNTLLTLIRDAQLALLHGWHTLGLSGDIHGQPAWPWTRRIAGETLLIDLGLARQLAYSLLAIAVALACVVIAGLWRRRRLPWLGVAALALVLAPWPSPALLFTPATPTSFHTSPTRFSVTTIAAGARIYAQHCVTCHGADGRGEGLAVTTLTRWPPTFASPLLGRRAEGELFWHIADGLRDGQGQPTMPAFGGRIDDAGTWAVIDYIKALAAGTGAATQDSWPIPLRLPEVTVRCGHDAPRPLAAWRGTQRVRVVAFDGPADALPLEDPRFLTLLVTRDARPLAHVPQFRAGCVALSTDAWPAFARIAGTEASQLSGVSLLADGRGWLRARAPAGRDAWRETDLLCTTGQAGTPPPVAQPAPRDGLTALLLRMDAEPVRFVQGGFVH